MERIHLHNYEAFLLDYCEGKLLPNQIAELTAFVVLHPELEIDLSDLSLPSIGADTGITAAHENMLKEFDPTSESVLNYLEGQLGKTERIEFEHSLESDAALRSLLSDYKATILNAEFVEMPGKSELIHSEDSFVLANSALNYLEGQLNAVETALYEDELQQDVMVSNELAAFRATVLIPDTTIQYPNKAALLRSPKVIALFSGQRAYYAAAAIVLMLVFAFLFRINYTGQNTEPSLAQSTKSIKQLKQVPPISQKNAVNLASQVPVRRRSEVISPTLQTNMSVNTSSLQTIELVVESNTTSLNPNKDLALPGPVQETPVIQDQIPSNFAAVNPNANTVYSSVEDLVVTDDLPEIKLPRKKTDVWHKAVDLARRANGLGFTAVKGEEEELAKSYRLSFNSFSVEKH